jgi:cobalt-zinc-cadmium efflux system protein
MTHEHHHHHHAPANHNASFAIGVLLNTGFVAVEAIFGVLSHSLALVADAGHNLSDVLGLLLAWGAMHLTRRPPTQRRTYGLRRSSILAALANAVFLLVAIGAIAWEAIRRFSAPTAVEGRTVIWVAIVGIVVNSITALLFMSGRKRDVNIEGAFLHMAADAAVSLGVVVAGVMIAYTGWLWIDPVVSLVIVAVIAWGTWGLLRKSLNLAMDVVPEHIDPSAVKEYLTSLPGVTAVHDLHIWGMSTTEAALTAHMVKPVAGDEDDLLARAAEELHQRFGIEHATIQIERNDNQCRLVPDEVV